MLVLPSLTAESCEDPHYHLEIHPAGDQAAESQLVNSQHLSYYLLTHSFLCVHLNCINLYFMALCEIRIVSCACLKVYEWQ